jgi:hypothetical protein
VLARLDEAAGNVDDMEEWLAVFNTKLRHMREDIEAVSSTRRIGLGSLAPPHLAAGSAYVDRSVARSSNHAKIATWSRSTFSGRWSSRLSRARFREALRIFWSFKLGSLLCMEEGRSGLAAFVAGDLQAPKGASYPASLDTFWQGGVAQSVPTSAYVSAPGPRSCCRLIPPQKKRLLALEI